MPLVDASLSEEGPALSKTPTQSDGKPRPHPPTSFKRHPSFPPPQAASYVTTEAATSFMRLSVTPSEIDVASALESEADQSESAMSTWSYHATDRSSKISHADRQRFDTFGPRRRGGADRSPAEASEHGQTGENGGGDEGTGRERKRETSSSTVSSTSGSIYHTALSELRRHRSDGSAHDTSSGSSIVPPSRIDRHPDRPRDGGPDIASEEAKTNTLPGTVFRFERTERPARLAPSPLPALNDRNVHFAGSPEPGHPSSSSGILRNPSNASSVTRHRTAASVPHFEPLQDSQTSISPNKQSPLQYTPSPRQRGRSRSIDSISLHPSISDSVTGLLIPPISTLPPAVSRPGLQHRSTSSMIPAELAAKNELDPEQRAILVRRARKLEQLLGRSMDEREIERLLIDPITAPRTITTQATDQAWPESPPPESGTEPKGIQREERRRSLAEWQKEDCIPRLDRSVETPPLASSSHGLARSGSFLARKARSALGMGTAAGEGKKKGRSDLAVYVSREVRVSETSEGRAKANRQTLSSPPAVVRNSRREISGAISGSPTSPSASLAESSRSDDEGIRRTRRLQLAKLHRLIGVPIPPDLVGRHSQDSDSAGSPEAGVDNDRSFMVFEDKFVTPSVNWAAAFKQTLNKVRSRDKSPAPTPPTMSREGSSVDMGSVGAMAVMNDKEKAVARKKAQKLEYMFGDAPPQSMFLPRALTPNEGEAGRTSDPPGQGGGRARQVSAGSFDAYEQSLAGLIYLADNDVTTLDTLMDQLELNSEPSQTPISPSSPAPGPHTHQARRKRTGKLTHFFGETGIDFDDPPNVEDTMDRVRSRSNANTSGGKDTLDEMMREMWRGVQAEVIRGGMAVKEGERLGEMIDRLRRRRGSVGQWEAL